MDNFIIAVNCVLPIFLLLCVGIVARRMNFVPVAVYKQLSSLAFYVLLPCVLFNNIYNANISSALQSDILVYLVAMTILWFAVNFVFFRWWLEDPRDQGAYIQNAFRSNVGVIGLVLAQNLMDASGQASLAVAITVIVPVFNILVVITLESCRGHEIDLRKTLRGILTNPLIYGCELGLLCVLLGIKLPMIVEKTIGQMGTAGTVVILISLGASLQLQGVVHNIKGIIFGNFYRLIFSPFVAIAVAIFLGFRDAALGGILVITAAPLAVSAYPMAIACDSNAELTGQLVATTSFLCSITFTIWIFILKEWGFM